MRKRIISLFLVLGLMPSLSLGAFAAAGLDNFKKTESYESGRFTDVKTGAWYEEGIAGAYELGIVNGMTASTYEPSGNLTIAQTLVLAARLHSIYHTGKAEFVQGTPWYQVYLDYCINNGIVAEGEYTDMKAAATRADFAVIFSKAIPAEALPAINSLEGWEIPDVPADAPYRDAAYLLYSAGILIGSDDFGSFKPGTGIMRSEVATIVTRMADKSLRKGIEGFEQKETVAANLQGVYRSADGQAECVWEGSSYCLTLTEEHEDGSVWMDHYSGAVGAELRQNVWGYVGEGGGSWIESERSGFVLEGSRLTVYPDREDEEEYYELYLAEDSILCGEAASEYSELLISADKLYVFAIESVEIAYYPETVPATGTVTDYLGVVLGIDGGEHDCVDSSLLSFESSDESVITVDENGDLSGLAVGSARLSAAANGHSDSVSVKVVKNPGEDIKYLGTKKLEYYEGEGFKRLVFALEDKYRDNIAADVVVDVRIVNSKGETVYERSHMVYADYSFSIWSPNGNGAGELAAHVDIHNGNIAPGSSSTGTLYCTISEKYGLISFDEFALSIRNLPVE